jgi:hypothetical protein
LISLKTAKENPWKKLGNLWKKLGKVCKRLGKVWKSLEKLARQAPARRVFPRSDGRAIKGRYGRRT